MKYTRKKGKIDESIEACQRGNWNEGRKLARKDKRKPTRKMDRSKEANTINGNPMK